MAGLSLPAVRQLAEKHGLVEVQFSTQSSVVVFTSAAGSRINVWYTTGTVGTYIHHPRQGRTQLFRRNVSISLLSDIFRNPRKHTGLDYHVKEEQPAASALAACPRLVPSPSRRASLSLLQRERAASASGRESQSASLSLLSDIFRNPRKHTGLGYHVKKEQPAASALAACPRLVLSPSRRASLSVLQRERAASASGRESQSRLQFLRTPIRKSRSRSRECRRELRQEEVGEAELEEEAAARAQLEKLKKERAALGKEIANVQAIFSALQDKRRNQRAEENKSEKGAEDEKIAEKRRQRRRPKAEQEERARNDAVRKERGKQMMFLSADKSAELKFEKQWWADDMPRNDISCVAMADDSTYIFVHDEQPDLRFSAGLPLGLSNFLHKKDELENHARPDPRYIALGSMGRYYCEVENAERCPEYDWHGPQSLTDELNEYATRDIRSLSFGEDWEAWFIVYADGSWRSAGSSVPHLLTTLIGEKRGWKEDLEFVSLGPNGSFFLRTGNGGRWWTTTDAKIDEALDKKSAGSVLSVLFGRDPGSCFIRGNWDARRPEHLLLDKEEGSSSAPSMDSDDFDSFFCSHEINVDELDMDLDALEVHEVDMDAL